MIAVSPVFAKVHVWTFDHVAGVAGIVVGAVAAWFAFLAWRSSNAAAGESRRHRSADVQPRPSMELPTHQPNGSSWWVTLSNAGGAVVDGRILVQHGDTVYGARFGMGDHVTGYSLVTNGEYPARSAVIQVRVLIAKDRDGGWWDCVKDERVDVAWESTLDADSIAWVNRQVADV